jgi:hypothetical protein
VFLLIIIFKGNTTVGSGSDYAKIISPANRTNVGKRNLYRLPAACCQWRLGVGAVTAGGRQAADTHSPNWNSITRDPETGSRLLPNNQKPAPSATLNFWTVFDFVSNGMWPKEHLRTKFWSVKKLLQIVHLLTDWQWKQLKCLQKK